MTTDLAVILSYTHHTKMMDDYIRQLKAAKIDVIMEKMTDFKPEGKYGEPIGRHFNRLRQQINKSRNYQYLILSDAFDVIFFGTKDSVLSKISNRKVTIAAERNCFPDITLIDRIPGDSIWKYTNGGLIAGTPENLLYWLDHLEGSRFYHPSLTNQGLFNLMLMDGSLGAELDDHTNLFYCLYHEGNELQFERGLPLNTVYGTHPNFIHANGKWPISEMWNRYDWSIGQAKPIELHRVKMPFQSEIEIELCTQCKDRYIQSAWKASRESR